jgi:hypothetical protein
MHILVMHTPYILVNDYLVSTFVLIPELRVEDKEGIITHTWGGISGAIS